MSLRLSFALSLALLLTACAGGNSNDSKKPDAKESCDEGLRLCQGSCVDTGSDPAHCGGCDVACDEGETCQDGFCFGPCDEGSELCGGRCVRVDVDAANCGSCGNACAAGEVCSAGSCMEACDEGLEACSGSCVDLQSDEDHCGECGEACGDGLLCIAGSCVCKPGLTRCGDACVDTANDARNCGGCFFDCTAQANVADATCSDGVCHFVCEEGAADCDEMDTNGCEADLTGEDHCGTCFNVCDGETTCNGESCVCEAPFGTCDGVCVNLDEDVRNCGECGRDCHAGGTSGICRSGDCLLFCAMGWGDCDGDPTNGCEAEFDTDSEHCGACGRACGAGQVCMDGECERACDGGLRGCGDVCVDLANDPENCGTCGLSCEEQANVDSATCGGGSCDFVCSEVGGRWADCDGDSATGCEADLHTSSDHCGACNQPCYGECVEGECQLPLTISSIHNHTCALRPDGTVACWGSNSNGQLGDGSTTTPLKAVTVLRPDHTPFMGILEIGAGGDTENSVDFSFTCARTFEGRVYCWGDNTYGQLGIGSTASSPYPELVPGLTDVVQLSVGRRHACAVLSDETARCWGNNKAGQIGNGLKDHDQWTPTPVRINSETVLEGVRKIVAGSDLTCALLDDETATCWGANGNMQLGDGVGTGGRSFAGTRVVDGATMQPMQGIVHIASTGPKGCAVLKDGTARCWGYQGHGGLGDGISTNNTPYGVPVLQSTGGPMVTDIATIDMGRQHICLAFESGGAACWGWNFKGRLGINDTAFDRAKGRPHPLPMRDPDDPSQPLARKVIDIAAGFAHTCVLVEGGEAFCTGDNGAGFLGIGQLTDEEVKLQPVVF